MRRSSGGGRHRGACADATAAARRSSKHRTPSASPPNESLGHCGRMSRGPAPSSAPMNTEVRTPHDLPRQNRRETLQPTVSGAAEPAVPLHEHRLRPRGRRRHRHPRHRGRGDLVRRRVRQVASVDGVSISRTDYRARYKIEAWRYDQAEARLRDEFNAGRLTRVRARFRHLGDRVPEAIPVHDRDGAARRRRAPAAAGR